ncbi:MAG: hypothetical protein JRF71_02165 [Deltaproteobacteria bacterium]|nr:hypothetical protein [Deltaproteobacteria bacterium]MBW2199629.1 hypothetical protein [Deltaproteobacteria bacterium]MBW2539846.1 hypothetical protein [Deltaproteobacteria bacterium]
MTLTSHAVTLEELRADLPKQFMGWISRAQDQIYNPQTIFSYIDGGAEVYRAYNMRQCLSRRYTNRDGRAIVIDLFDMGSSHDAFGVFTHDPEGDVINLGQDARFRPGWLNFWKDRFFVSIYMEEESAAAEKVVKELGKQVDSIITTRGPRPQILQQLPPQGLKSDSIRYLHHPIILNYHFYLSDENILNLSLHTDAVLAGYERDEGQALLLLVSYPEPEAAQNAHISFFKHYLPDADQNGIAFLENGKWSAALVKGRLLAIVLEADSRTLAKNLLKNVRKNP